MKRIASFFRNSWLAFKGVSLWLNPQAYLTEKIVNPVFRFMFYGFLLAYGYKTTENATVYILANAMLLSTISAFNGVGIIYFSERHQGTLIYTIISPKSKFVVIFQKVLYHIFDALITVTIGVVLAAIIFDFRFTVNIYAALLFISILGTISVSTFGIFISSFGLLTRDINMLLSIAESVVFLFSGANFPVKRLPFGLNYVSQILPLSHAVSAIRLVVNGNIWYGLSLSCMEIAIGLIYFTLSILLIRFLERQARTRGNSDLY
ncbi:MAG: ABC transporter permease [Athalassotoga sp.]|uniref:ABC transporter permease n=2 Tax=Bacteria TaxID=2 RepID=UPI003D081156